MEKKKIMKGMMIMETIMKNKILKIMDLASRTKDYTLKIIIPHEIAKIKFKNQINKTFNPKFKNS